MKFIISSHISYYIHTYPIVVQSLLDCGINNNDIIMVVGNSVNSELNNFLDINLISVPYNSFDLTGLIYVSDVIDTLQFNHIFLMHDTCLVGPKFKTLVSNYQPTDVIKTLCFGISMNIGLYSKIIIKHNKQYLNDIKFYPKTAQDLQSIKEFFVINEDIIFKKYSDHCYNNHFITNSSFLTLNELRNKFNRPPYINYIDKLELSNIKRDIGYTPDLDFYKLQANSTWGESWKIGI